MGTNISSLRPAPASPNGWWTDPRQVALVKRTTGKDCMPDEFDEFVAVCRELNLSPLRRQIYCFIFSKDDAARRNMTLVVGIDGARSIAARTGNYRPDNQEPQWVFKDELKNVLTNPHGIEKCTVGIFHRPTHNDPFERIVHTVFWDEFAPIVERGNPDAYEWVGTGQNYPAGHKKAGQERMTRRLREGANANVEKRIDPDKQQWVKAGRNQIAKCAEMGALRKGWPEDLSRVVVEEETHRSAVLENVEYEDLTPTQMAEKAESASRLERLGGPALFAVLDDTGTLQRIEIGKFADRMLDVTENMKPDEVKSFVESNKAAINEFWAHNKTDALELKKELEKRSEGGTSRQIEASAAPAKAAASKQGETDAGAAAPKSVVPKGKLTGVMAEHHKKKLLDQIAQLDTPQDLLYFGADATEEINRLPEAMANEVRTEFQSRQSRVKSFQ